MGSQRVLTHPLDPRRFAASDAAQLFAWFVGTVTLYSLWLSGSPAGPRWVIAALLAVTILGVAVDARQDTRALFRAKNFVMAFVFYTVLLNVAQGSDELLDISPASQTRAAAHYCLFVTTWLLAYALSRGSRRFPVLVERFIGPIGGRALLGAIVVIFIAEMTRRLAFSGWDFSQLVQEHLYARSGEGSIGRGRFGDWRVFLEPFTWLYGYIPLFSAFAWDRVRSLPRRAVLVVLSGIVLTTLFLGGTRAALAVPVISIIAYRMVLARPRQRLLWLGGAALTAFLLAPLMDLQLRYRNVGWHQQPIRVEGVATNPLEAARDTNFREMAAMMDAVDLEGGRPAAEFYFYMLIAPIPRFLWPDKPYMSQEYIGPYRREYASMSSVGDMYLYGGLPHVIIGALILGWWVRTLDRFLPAATTRPEWLFVYLLAVWLAATSLRAIWNVVVHSEWLVVVLSVLIIIGRRQSAIRQRSPSGLASGAGSA